MLKRLPQRLFIFITIALLTAGLLGILALYNQLSRISEMDVLQSYRQAVEQTAINLNDRMAFAEEAMRSLLYDVRMQASLTRSEEDETLENQIEEISDLREMIYSIEKNHGITRIRLYLNDQKMVTREGINFFSLSQALDIPEYQAALDKKGLFTWIGAHEIRTRYYVDNCVTLACLYRAYFAPVGRNWGLILIDLSLDYFTEILNTLEPPDTQASVVITDKNRSIVVGHGDPQMLHELSALNEPWGFVTTSDGEKLAYVTADLPSAGWRLTTYIPKDNLLNNRQTLRTMLTLLLFGLTLLMISVATGVLYIMYGREVRAHILSIHKNLKSNGETNHALPATHALFDLDRNLSELLETNRQLAKENYHAQLREREVTLQVLQAQINPHFLYNTLDSINWMAMRDGAYSVSDVIATLAEYFRLSLSQGRSIVSLREDMEIAKKYISLYKHRYEYAIHVEWLTADEALNCEIPKLTLQPLIENALQHGIFKRDEKQSGAIYVTACIEGEEMVLTIRDNGPGLQQLNGMRQGYGLSNVRERLDLHFGSQYSMTIENAPQGGALVTISVKAKKIIR